MDAETLYLMSRGSMITFNVIPVGSAVTATPGALMLANAAGGAFTITLPICPIGSVVAGKQTDNTGNAVTLSPASGRIDGSTTYTLNYQYDYLWMVYDGVNWNIL